MPRDILLWHPHTGEVPWMVSGKGVCVNSDSVLESINNLKGKSLQSWAEAKERQAHW